MTRQDRRHHADEVFAVAEDRAAAARSAVAASWVRSLKDYGLDPEAWRPPEPMSAAELAAARERMGPMLAAAQPGLDGLFAAVGESGCSILLTDKDGAPLERRGRAGDDEMFHKAGLWTGMVWHEAVEGTNGVGTTLAEGRAITIHRDQHFFTRNIGLSCIAAPLFDHEGKLAGALDVSSCRGDLDQAVASLIAAAVRDAARRIEAAHFRTVFRTARIVLGPEPDNGALLALDRHDLIVGANRAARRQFGLTSERIAAGAPAASVLGAETDAPESLDEAAAGAIRRALARAGGNISQAARDLGLSRATLHRRINRLGLSHH